MDLFHLFVFQAYKEAVKSKKTFKIHGLGLTPDMLFFLSYAQVDAQIHLLKFGGHCVSLIQFL